MNNAVKRTAIVLWQSRELTGSIVIGLLLVALAAGAMQRVFSIHLLRLQSAEAERARDVALRDADERVAQEMNASRARLADVTAEVSAMLQQLDRGDDPQ